MALRLPGFQTGGWTPLSGDDEGRIGVSDEVKDGCRPGPAVAVAGCGLFAMFFIGLIAAIAIPNFLAMQLRAKRAEAPTNADSLRTSQKRFHAEFGEFVALSACPPTVPGRERVAWTPCGPDWEELGWEPKGPVRCSYSVLVDNAGYSDEHNFTVTAQCDVDGDGSLSVYQATRAKRAAMISANNLY